MKRISLLLALFLFFAGSIEAQQAALRIKTYNLSNQLALSGYDAVSYFSASGPKKGSASYGVVDEGVTYRFASAENKALFLKNPKAYQPQYGGWCAYAMGATGEKVEVDPKTYKILNGKLYLFYNAYFTNTLKQWNRDEKALLPKADAAWTKWYK